MTFLKVYIMCGILYALYYNIKKTEAIEKYISEMEFIFNRRFLIAFFNLAFVGFWPYGIWIDLKKLVSFYITKRACRKAFEKIRDLQTTQEKKDYWQDLIEKFK